MTDFRVAAYETYLSAWSAVPDNERLRLLRESVTEAIQTVWKVSGKGRNRQV